MKVYMRVTQDKYSLPLDFDTSPTALARRLGEPCHTVFQSVWRQRNGKSKGYPRYVCVEVENDDESWLDIMIDTIRENNASEIPCEIENPCQECKLRNDGGCKCGKFGKWFRCEWEGIRKAAEAYAKKTKI